jgi:hypothetical protein
MEWLPKSPFAQFEYSDRIVLLSFTLRGNW